jgi:hypothetical protein
MSEPETYQFPHHAEINFTIKISKMLPDGSLDTTQVSEKELLKYGIAKKAMFTVVGVDKIDCIKKVKEVLENLKYE